MEQSGYGNLDPADVPAVLEIFSKSSAAMPGASGGWLVGLVVKHEQGLLTIRFLDQGEAKEKVVRVSDSVEVDYFGTHLGWASPPGVIAVPSSTRKGRVSYFDPNLQQKFATPELAWQAYLEHHLKGIDFQSQDSPSPPLRAQVTQVTQVPQSQGVPRALESPVHRLSVSASEFESAESAELAAKISKLCGKSLEQSDLGDLGDWKFPRESEVSRRDLGAKTKTATVDSLGNGKNEVRGSLAEELAAARAEAIKVVKARQAQRAKHIWEIRG